MQYPRLIGHRCCRGLAPENTLAALEAAKQWGLTCVEFDVRLTRSGEVVVFHDDTLERTTNGKGALDDYTYAEVAALDAGTWFSASFVHEKIPLFSDYLKKIADAGLMANVEIKSLPGKEAQTASAVYEVLEAFKKSMQRDPSSMQDAVIISSFEVPALAWFHAQAPYYPLALLLDTMRPDWLLLCESLNCKALHLSDAIITEDIAKAVKAESQLQLAVYTVNDAERASQLWDWGVDAIFTDYPDRMAVD